MRRHWAFCRSSAAGHPYCSASSSSRSLAASGCCAWPPSGSAPARDDFEGWLDGEDAASTFIPSYLDTHTSLVISLLELLESPYLPIYTHSSSHIPILTAAPLPARGASSYSDHRSTSHYMSSIHTTPQLHSPPPSTPCSLCSCIMRTLQLYVLFAAASAYASSAFVVCILHIYVYAVVRYGS